MANIRTRDESSDFFSALPSAKVGVKYTQENRSIQSIRKIVVKGSVDVYFRRSSEPQLLVAGETKGAIDSIRTRVKGDKLIIENEGPALCVSGFSYGNVSVGHAGGGVHIKINGQSIHIGGNLTGMDFGRAVVGVSLPEIPVVNVKGSGDITLLDLQQVAIEFEIKGSGNIKAYGLVDVLNVSVVGSGDVDCSNLIANQANLSVAGSGDIDAFVRQSVSAVVAGSGDILVRGDPTQRTQKVVGSGDVIFRPKNRTA